MTNRTPVRVAINKTSWRDRIHKGYASVLIWNESLREDDIRIFQQWKRDRYFLRRLTDTNFKTWNCFLIIDLAISEITVRIELNYFSKGYSATISSINLYFLNTSGLFFVIFTQKEQHDMSLNLMVCFEKMSIYDNFRAIWVLVGEKNC